ncbi:hypothetical protein PMAC_000451 [Pneumocystis sp. 'macacae']|nr:hypothetical protein PMAC_000451 [Pneumocystis sp. 'macacae']
MFYFSESHNNKEKYQNINKTSDLKNEATSRFYLDEGFNKTKDIENIGFKKKDIENLDLNKNQYVAPSMHQVSKILSSNIETGIIENENMSDTSEVFHDSQVLLSDNDFCDNDVFSKDIKSSGLNEFVEILKKKKNDFSKIKNSEKMLFEVPNNQVSSSRMEFAENDYINASKKLSLLEMIAPLRANILTNSHLKSLNGKRIFSSSDNVLSAPLAKSIQDCFDRQAAYDIVKKELEKWKDIVKYNRESEILRFPVDSPEKKKLTNNLLSTKFQVSTPFEESIDKVLQSSGLKNEKSIFESEKLHFDEFFANDKAHYAEFRLMRDLMFRQELKAKRISKIKSKSYRRIRKHEKKKIKSLALNKIGTDELRFQEEINKAKERMGFRYSNAKKWAKKKLIDSYSNIDIFQFMSKRQYNEHLKRKIQGTYSSDSEENLDNVNKNNISYKRDLLVNSTEFDRNENIESLDDLMSMRFMKSSKRVRNMGNKETVDGVLRIENASEILSKEYNDNIESFECSSYYIGRKIFNPLLNKAHISNINDKEFIEISGAKQSSNLVDKKSLFPVQSLKDSNTCSKDSNPWLLISYKSLPGLCELELDRDIRDSILYKNIKDHKKANESGLYIDLFDELLLPVSTIEKDRYNSDLEKENINISYSSSGFVLKHRDLVARAFSGDNVLGKFEEEKSKDIEECESYEKDISMPGWGSWCGIGTKYISKKIKKVSGVLKKDRKDMKLGNVIMSEKRIKNNARLLVSSVPYPYQTKEQYERSLMLPFGPEWTTREQYQKRIVPRIVIKQGSIIEPLKISS